MPKTSSLRTTLAASLFLLSTFNPCTGITHKSPQDINGEKLLQAIQSGDVQKAATLLQQNLTPNLNIQDNGTALHWACHKGYTNIVRLLLEKGADPNARDTDNLTPLHDAAMQGHQDIIELLLQYKANKNFKHKHIPTPFDLANALPDNNKAAIVELVQPNTFFNPTNITIGTLLLVVLSGLGYFLWPTQEDNTSCDRRPITLDPSYTIQGPA